jgi:hypothetical protein
MTEARRADGDGVHLVVSIDTEEDDWHRSRSDVTVKNIDELPRLAAFFDRLRVRPTYFTAYQVVMNARAAAIMRDVGCADRGEIGAHLHPWNTPPLTEDFVPRNSMLKNLPAELQEQKLSRMTDAMEDAFAFTPGAFRAGRYGLGRNTVGALVRAGYRVDSSVTPYISWKEVDDGPSFVGAPVGVYRLSPGRDVNKHSPSGKLIELPLSCGFSRTPFDRWSWLRGVFDAPPLRPARLVQVAGRTRLFKRIVLSPEIATVTDMLTLSRRLIEMGTRHLHLTCHSPSFKPGLSPFAATARDVKRLYDSMEAYIDGLSRLTSVTFSTVSETAERLAPRARASGALEVAAC